MIVAACVVVAALAALSCDDNGRDRPGPEVARAPAAGDPRTLRLGFSTLPPETTNDAYVGAFATIARYGEIALIQRTPPWTEFMPGGTVSSATADTTRLEIALLRQYDLKLFYAVDPTDGVVQRSRIANLPSTVDPEVGFRDRNLRNAFVAYTTYVVKNYHPDYLALGVEINMLKQRAGPQFDAFVSLYNEAYAAAKDADPRTKVFPTFQLEDLEGRFGSIHPPDWEALDAFRGRMDALAISTYPFLGDIHSAADLPPGYYAQLKAHFGGEILISEAGYASAPVEGATTVGTEEDQRAFVTRLLGDAEANAFSFVIWFAALDPSFVRQGSTAALKDIGLRKSDGSNKLGWGVWEEWARRPLR